MAPNPSLTSLLADWSFEPRIVLGIILTGAIYVAGLRELGRRGKLWRVVRRRHAVFFALGLLTLALALMSPLDTLDTRLFSVHMAQHLLLLQLAPALLLLGKPVPALLVGLPRPAIRAVARAHHRTPWLRRLTHQLTAPLVAWPLYVADLLLWHVPALYQATLVNEGVHLLEHVCFLLTGVLFWWVVVEPLPGPARLHTGARLLHAVSAMLPMGLMAALFTFADTLWYPFYATQPQLWGWSAIDDQRLGGIVMWLPGSLFYMVAASILFFKMLVEDERAGDAESDGEGAGDMRMADDALVAATPRNTPA